MGAKPRGRISFRALFFTLAITLSSIAANSAESASAATPAADGYDAAVLADVPLGYWPLREPSGGSVEDRLGGPAGAVEGNSSLGAVPGPIDGTTALHVAGGACDGVNLDGNWAHLHPDAVTVESWVRTTDGRGSGVVFRLRDGGYNLLAGASGVDLTLYPADHTVHASASVTDGRWHQIVGSYSPVAGYSVFVDGVLKATAPSNGTLTYFRTEAAIGRDGHACDGVVPSFVGDIADTSVYGTALSPAQISSHYNAAHSGTRTISTPDMKVVRYLQVPFSDCVKAVVLVGKPTVAGPACGFLVGSSNPDPPSNVSGTGWQKFVASKEFRGFIHISPMTISCTDGRITSVQSNEGLGVSPGWTPFTAPRSAGRVVKEKAEWYSGSSGIFHPDKVQLDYSSDRSQVRITGREASRIALQARTGQYAMLGVDAPFIWASLSIRVSCSGDVVANVIHSTIPRVGIYVDDALDSSTFQDADLAGFIRSGGSAFHLPGRGNLDPKCQRTRALPPTGDFLPDFGTPASCKQAWGDGELPV